MTLMAWSEQFACGIDAIDAQHRALVDMINAAAPHLVSGGPQARQQVGPMLDQLTQYAATHFKYEENLMQQRQVAPAYFEQHQRTHGSFVDEVLMMRKQYEQGAEPSGTELLHFLTSWLTFHILSEDKRLARQVLAIQAGASPEQAYGGLDTAEGAPQTAYTAALIDLFGLLTARNRTLSEANAEVRRAKLELEAANALLEQRVTTRTHELAATNATLEKERQALMES
ncbi:MAG: bacteriohemerythrin, partial [Rhodoferax sp.]|nr:bacteriohemerythrin [Rhodoferax sp.]